MLYEIRARNEKGLIETFHFDNLTNEVWNSEGELLDFRGDKHFREIPSPSNPSPRVLNVLAKGKPLLGKSNKLQVLKIQLGLKCNYHCSYCLQSAWRNIGWSPKESDVDDFMKRLEEAQIEFLSQGRIELWGGEPLVYVKVLRKLVPLLQNRYGVPISMITNGTLLTRELVDFFVENGVKICISHDGQGFSLRDDADPLFNPKIRDAWLYLHEITRGTPQQLTFNVVLTPKNCNLEETKAFFEKNFAPDVKMGIEGVVTNVGVKGESVFSVEKALDLQESIYRALTENPSDWEQLVKIATPVLQRMIYRIPMPAIQCRCNQARKDTFVTDLRGLLSVCQNRPVDFFGIGKLGNLKGAKNPYMKHWSKRAKCKNCPALVSCKGGCPVLTDAEHEASCKNEYIYHFALFKVVWAWLTRTKIQEIHPHNLEFV